MPRIRAGFIAPMLLLKTDALPDDGERWAYQLKVDGYRAIAFKRGGQVHLRSRNDHDSGPALRAGAEGARRTSGRHRARW